MLVYRISQTKYANSLTASGIDGRWNFLHQKMIYTAGSVALACLENLAHKSGASLTAGNFSLAIIDIGDLKIEEVKIGYLTSLYSNWNSVDQYTFTQKLGSDWFNANTAAVLKVPSAIIDLEYNYLLNPNHASFNGIKIVKVEGFRFDSRLKGGL